MHKFVITSGKGGVGKTTITACLGLSLSNPNCRVLLIDLDIGLNNLDIALGVEHSNYYDLKDALYGKCRLTQALTQVPYCPNLYVLTSNQPIDSIQDIKLINRLLESINNCYDYVLIDCPAGISDSFKYTVELANSAIIVTTTHISAIRDADKVIRLLYEYGIPIQGVVVNRVRGDLILDDRCLSPENVAQILEVNLLSSLPEDDLASDLSLGLNSSKNLKKAIIALEHSIKDGGSPYDCTNNYKGITGAIKRKLRKLV